MNIMIRLFVLILTLLGPIGFSFAEEQAQLPKETELSEQAKQVRIRAKKRLYPGGRDEEPLQVQEQLPNPSRGQGEAAAEEAEHD